MRFFSRTKKLEEAEQKAKREFFNMYDNAKDMIENHGAVVNSSDKNSVIEISSYCENKEKSQKIA